MPQASSIRLLSFAIDETVSCLYADPVSELLVVGCVNGAVYLLFTATTKQPCEPDYTEKKGEDLVIDINETVRYQYIMLRKSSPEAIRTAYISNESSRLIVSSGDRVCYIWSLDRLAYDVTIPGDMDAKCFAYSYNRVHTRSNCVQTIIFQNKGLILGQISSSPYLFATSFDCLLGANHFLCHNEDNEIPKDFAPEEFWLEAEIMTGSRACSFDGLHLLILNAARNFRGYMIQVYQWKKPRLQLIQELAVYNSFFSSITPTCIHSLGDFVLAVCNLNVLRVWRISTGESIFSFRGSSYLSNIVQARLFFPLQDNYSNCDENLSAAENLLIVSLSTDRKIRLWRNGKLTDSHFLPKKSAIFNLGGPYFMEPKFEQDLETEQFYLKTVVYNDDTGLHASSP